MKDQLDKSLVRKENFTDTNKWLPDQVKLRTLDDNTSHFKDRDQYHPMQPWFLQTVCIKAQIYSV